MRSNSPICFERASVAHSWSRWARSTVRIKTKIKKSPGFAGPTLGVYLINPIAIATFVLPPPPTIPYGKHCHNSPITIPQNLLDFYMYIWIYNTYFAILKMIQNSWKDQTLCSFAASCSVWMCYLYICTNYIATWSLNAFSIPFLINDYFSIRAQALLLVPFVRGKFVLSFCI